MTKFDRRVHLTPIDLACRWRTTLRTLEAWRYREQGPKYIKVGTAKRGSILYRISDIISYESKMTKEFRDRFGIDNGRRS